MFFRQIDKNRGAYIHHTVSTILETPAIKDFQDHCDNSNKSTAFFNKNKLLGVFSYVFFYESVMSSPLNLLYIFKIFTKFISRLVFLGDCCVIVRCLHSSV